MDIGAVSTNSITSNALQGLKKATNTLENAAQNIAEGSVDPQDVVSLSQASTGYKANAAVIKTDGELNKSLLDIKA